MERRALVDALITLAPPAPSGPRVLGGSFFASSGDAEEINIDIDTDPVDERTETAHSAEASLPEASFPEAPLVFVEDRLAHWSKS
jgi:hypothetical protein